MDFSRVPEPLALRSFLGEIGEEIVLAVNPGNAGDSVIAHATYQALDAVRLPFQSVGLECDESVTSGRVVVYGGGGNFIPAYPNARAFLARHHRRAKRMIVLPHTIRGNEDLLGEFGANTTLVCREHESYAHVSRHARHARVCFSDDVAFGLDISATLIGGRALFLPVVSRSDLLVRNLKRTVRAAGHFLRNLSHPKTLYAFRKDVERSRIRAPRSNIDVSQVFATEDMQRYRAHEATYRLLRFLSRFNTVHTNRLHVGIVAALLGRAVYLYENSYGKIGAVYAASMQGKYPNVAWCGDAAPS